MSTPNKVAARQVISTDVLSRIALASGTTLDSLLKSINSEVTAPFNLSPSASPDLIVSVGPSRVANPITSRTHTVTPIGGDVPTFTSGTITFPSSSGGTVTVSPGTNSTLTVSSGNWIKATVYMDSGGSLNVLFGVQGATEAAATTVAAPSGTLAIGYISLQNSGGVIQPITNAMIYQFAGAGGASSSSGSGTGDDLDSLQFRASFYDTFQENAASSVSSINGTSATNATYSAAKQMYTMSYDAGKTMTTTGTAATLSATPAYTVAIGDVVVNRTTGEVRKITAVASQTSYTLESAFTANLSTTGVTVSQAVITKDIYNLAVDGVALSAGFSGATFSEIMIDYKDNASAGSNIFTPNTTPLVGFVASPDNTTFTTTNLRATNETDTAQSVIMSSAGTSLYLRFFSNASAGSGIVNLINYKAFMQKSTASAGGGVINAAYAFSNGVGTPVNCSLAVTGGKTVITLSTWQYAVGANSGLPYGAVDVYINGQMIPRFINSTLTPDASYLETSSKVITLDRDYSAQNLSIMVLQRVAIVDASSANSSNISYQQEIMQNGFQPFVNTQTFRAATSLAGTPAAGTFYSSLSNRSSIVDISQDLKVSFGTDRILGSQLVFLPKELGLNGEAVYGLVNDDKNLVRVVGAGWTNVNDNSGIAFQTGTTNDYMEITFFGTGLSLVAGIYSAAADLRASTDGGSEGSNIWLSGTGYSSLLAGRNYQENNNIVAVTGLTLGVHTVKIRFNAAVSVRFYGYEVHNFNSTSLLNVNPGIAYANGQKMVLASTNSPSYNSTFDSGALAARGGRVVVYQKADGTIGKAVTPTNTSAVLLNSADHSNEEMYKMYNPREFGAARSDDLSFLNNVQSTRGFNLDDNATFLSITNGIFNVPPANFPEGLSISSNSAQMILTFVGTGLDVLMYDNAAGGADQYTYSIDNAALANWPYTSGTVALRTQKVVSGLPYGSHTFTFNRNTATTYQPTFLGFKVYQPKKPTIPTGAIELADYNVAATYVQKSTDSFNNISTGVIRKGNMREWALTGTWVYNGINSTVLNTGLNMTTAVSGSSASYTFWGTGAEIRIYMNASAYNLSFTMDGVSNLSSLGTAAMVTSNTGLTFTGSTGALTGTASGGNGTTIAVTGMTLGLHTFKVTTNNTTGVNLDSIDIVTPAYSAKYLDGAFSAQDISMIGACSISDNRKFTPVKDLSAQPKAWAQAQGIVVSPSITSTSMVPMPDMSLTIKTAGGPVRVSGYAVIAPSTNTVATNLQIYVNGLPYGNQPQSFGASTAVVYQSLNVLAKLQLPAGTHKIDLYWAVNGGTATAVNTFRTLLAEETT